MKLFVITALAMLVGNFAQGQATAQQPASSDLAFAAACSRGLAETAEMLWKAPETLTQFHCVTVLKSNYSFDTGMEPKTVYEGVKEFPRRIRFKLAHHEPSAAGTISEDTFVDWITDTVGLRALPRPAKTILDCEPFSANQMLLYTLDPAKNERARYTRIIVLPSNFLPALTEAREWRQAKAKFFAPTEALSVDDADALRSELKAGNALVRLCVILRLTELHLAAFDDAMKVLSCSTSTYDSGALALLLLEYSPEWSKNLQSTALSLPLNSPALEGVAVGAAIHFLAQDGNLLKIATTYQGFRDETRVLPSELVGTMSYPILSALGDRVKPLRQRLTIEPATILARLLVATRALHKIDSSE